jgi:hypothetical protein
MNNISFKLFDYIENDTKENKSKLLLSIKEHKDNLKNKEDEIITAKEIFNATINQKRNQQQEAYKLYHYERMQLYNKWKKTKLYKDLLELVNYLPPEFEEIPDIFTYNYIRNPLTDNMQFGGGNEDKDKSEGEGVNESEGEGVNESEGEGVNESEGEGVNEREGEGVNESEGEGEGVNESEGEGVNESESEGESEDKSESESEDESEDESGDEDESDCEDS